jgi:hypothetical protein
MTIAMRLAVLLAWLWALPAAAQAESPDQPLAFAPRLVAAINGKNLERRKALLHPKVLACLTPQTRPFFEERLADQFRHAVPTNHRLRAEAIPPERPLSFGDGVEFPLRPTHQIHIEWDTSPYRSVTIIAFLAYHEGTWRQVLPCVRPEKVPQMQAAKEARRKQEQRAQSLAANMPPSLRADLSRLMSEGRKIDAIKEYQRASGEDLSTAKSVVELITSR